jgi:D-alanyl-D-alanine carboxypeptidase
VLRGLLLSTESLAAEWASIVFEPESGAILQAEEDRAPRYPASLTKMMTAYLVLEAVKSGKLKLTQPLKISKAAAAQPAVDLSLRAGRTITVEEALYATILRSANDAAGVLAEAVDGSEEAFAYHMTAKARTLGMRGTLFANATGLPHRSHISSAYDMALLARALLRDYPNRYPIFAQTSASYGKRRYGTINGWLTAYRGADGIKTGFTCAAGYNLVASAKRDGRRLIAVVMGGRSPGARAGKARALMDAAFKQAAKPGGAAARLGTLGRGPAILKVGAPPHVLPGGKCASSKKVKKKALLEGGPFPGWGVVFGSYSSKSKALAAIKKRRGALGKLASGARPAVVAKARGGVVRFSALLVSLKEAASMSACRRLRDAGDYCLRLRPAVLNNTTAKWR